MKETYSVITVIGRHHALCNAKPRHIPCIGNKKGIDFPKPNYHGSGMALCGICLKGESLTEFTERKQKLKKKYAALLKNHTFISQCARFKVPNIINDTVTNLKPTKK